MRKPAKIKEWISPDKLQLWVKEAPTKEAYQKRLAIWLTVLGPYHAHDTAKMLGVSKQAVWLWISQYNNNGPEGIQRIGRGGRRWGYLTEHREKELFRKWKIHALNGDTITAKQVLPEVEYIIGKKVSLDYIYKLLKRFRLHKL